MKTGDLILIKSQKVFDDSITSFRDKWGVATASKATPATAMAMAAVSPPAPRLPLMVMAMGVATPGMVMVTNKKTNKTIKLQYCGYDWKVITFPFIGIITEIIPEKDHDLDVFKIYHDNQYFYCRRSIIEGSVK